MRSLAAGLAIAVLAVAPLPGARAGAPESLRPTAREATIARVVVATAVRGHPLSGAPVRERLTTQAEWGGGPVALLVLRSAREDGGRLWVKVRLQRRPNAAAGWIPADRAVLTRTPWRIRLRLGPRTLTVHRGGRTVRRMRAVIGAAATPTPRGLFAIAEEIRQPDPFGFLGPWALHLSAHSNTLDDYGGGAGRVAIHGRDGASLLDPLGSARSHGCVRVDSREIRWLARRASAGVPVRVTG